MFLTNAATIYPIIVKITAIGNHSNEYCFNGRLSIKLSFNHPCVWITLKTEMIETIAIGICCAIGFVGINLANKINKIIVIATGYTMLRTGTDIVITEFNPWFANIKLMIVKMIT